MSELHLYRHVTQPTDSRVVALNVTDGRVVFDVTLGDDFAQQYEVVTWSFHRFRALGESTVALNFVDRPTVHQHNIQERDLLTTAL